MMEGWMDDKVEKIWKKAIVALSENYPDFSPGGTEENHSNFQSGQPVSLPNFEPSTSRMRL
jgi:hypothetical protein